MKYNSKSGIESRMKNGFSAMHVILSSAKYKFMTSSDTSEFAKPESYYYIYYYILTDRNENGINLTSAYISHTLTRRLDKINIIIAVSMEASVVRQLSYIHQEQGVDGTCQTIHELYTERFDSRTDDSRPSIYSIKKPKPLL